MLPCANNTCLHLTCIIVSRIAGPVACGRTKGTRPVKRQLQEWPVAGVPRECGLRSGACSMLQRLRLLAAGSKLPRRHHRHHAAVPSAASFGIVAVPSPFCLPGVLSSNRSTAPLLVLCCGGHRAAERRHGDGSTPAPAEGRSSISGHLHALAMPPCEAWCVRRERAATARTPRARRARVGVHAERREL